MAAGLTAPELRELSVDELATRLRESKEELFNLRFQVATGQLDNNRRLQTVRRDIARIYTVMRERELGIRATPAPAPIVEAKPKRSRAKKDAADTTTETAGVDATPVSESEETK